MLHYARAWRERSYHSTSLPMALCALRICSSAYLVVWGSLRSGHMAYTRLATWQAAQHPPLANLCLQQGSKLRKLWKSLLTGKEEREIEMDSRNEMCRVNEKGDL